MRALVCATCGAPVMHTGRRTQMEREFVSSRYSFYEGKSITETAKVKFLNNGLGKWVCLKNRNHKTAVPKKALHERTV